MTTDVPAAPTTRAGYVAIVGLPNVGKSTLLNHFVGEHLSIATAKAQTTWQRVTGILTEGDCQVVFLDTPGLLDPRDLLQRSMRNVSLEALAEADVVLVVVDVSERANQESQSAVASVLPSTKAPIHVALNKMDGASEASLQAWTAWTATIPGARAHPVSAREGTWDPLESTCRHASLSIL